MAVPKRKMSKSKIRMRRRSKHAIIAQVSACAECGAAQQAHHACPSCGTYRGRQVITAEAV